MEDHFMSVLKSSPLNLAQMRDQSEKALLSILDEIEGTKCLVLDPNLFGALSLITQASILEKHYDELESLSAEPLATKCSTIVYLVQGRLELMEHISCQIQDFAKKKKEFFVIFIPRRSVACEQILREKKVYDLLRIGEYPLYMIPLEEDLISFELDFAYKELLVDGDRSCLSHISQAVHQLELFYGKIPDVQAKGEASVQIAQMLDRLQREKPANSNDLPVIEKLILIDRQVDMITPMLSPMTHEGVIDKFLHFRGGPLRIDSSIFTQGQGGKVLLNSRDNLFQGIRDKCFRQAVSELDGYMARLEEAITKSAEEQNKVERSLRAKHYLPSKIIWHNDLARHLSTFAFQPSFLDRVDKERHILGNRSSPIHFDYIDEIITNEEPLLSVLQLLVLLSVANSGLPTDRFNHFRSRILQTYGHQHMPTLKKLEKAGIFRREVKGVANWANWQGIKEKLNLVDHNIDPAKPIDIAYVFAGYAPLSVRIVQSAMNSNWHRIENTLKLLPGPQMYTKKGDEDEFQPYVDSKVTPVVLVVFVGGVTYAEIAALRLVKKQWLSHVVIATTKIVDGKTLLEPFCSLL